MLSAQTDTHTHTPAKARTIPSTGMHTNYLLFGCLRGLGWCKETGFTLTLLCLSHLHSLFAFRSVLFLLHSFPSFFFFFLQVIIEKQQQKLLAFVCAHAANGLRAVPWLMARAAWAAG